MSTTKIDILSKKKMYLRELQDGKHKATFLLTLCIGNMAIMYIYIFYIY